MNLPNKITTFRMVMVIALVIIMLFPYQDVGANIPMVFGEVNAIYFTALILFVVAALSDAFDGYFARKLNLVTNLGKFLDPIADKLLVNSLLIILLVPQVILGEDTTQMQIHILAVVLMIGRDLIVDALRLVAANQNKVLAANIGGKIKTVLQMVAIPAVLLNNWPFSYITTTINIAEILVWLATAASVISGIIYLVQNRYVLKEAHTDE